MSDTCEHVFEEWEAWMTQQDEERRKAERLEQFQASTENNITKSRPWRGGEQVLEDVFEEGPPLQRAEEKRQERKDHRQVDSPEKCVDNKPW